jgi:hypothetical protein
MHRQSLNDGNAPKLRNRHSGADSHFEIIGAFDKQEEGTVAAPRILVK